MIIKSKMDKAKITRKRKVAAALAAAMFVLISVVGIAYSAAPIFRNVNNGYRFNTTEDVRFEYYVFANDSEGDYPLNFSSDAVDKGFNIFSMENFNNTHALINFTPTNDYVTMTVGNLYSFHLIVDDANDPPDTTTITVYFNVSNVNDAPNITGKYPLTLTNTMQENDSAGFNYSYNASDVDVQWGDILNASWFVDKVLINSSTSNNSTWTYIPGFCDAGFHNVTLNITDLAGAYDNLTWTVNVTNLNRIPVLNNTIANMTFAEDTNMTNNFTITLKFYDNDTIECSGANRDTLTFNVTGNGSISVKINATTHNVSFYPKRNYFGNHSVRIIASDGINYTYSNIFNITVLNVNDPPVLSLIPDYTRAVNVSIRIKVNATDTDNDALIFYDDTDLFDIDSSTGLITFYPEISDKGNYSINISINDTNGGYASQIFDIELIPNHHPVLRPIYDWTGSDGMAFSKCINSTDADYDNMTFNATTSIFNMTVTNNGEGNATACISFTPGQSAVGNHSIRFTVKDRWGANDTRTMWFNITDVQHAPVLGAIPDIKIKINQTLLLQINATDEDDDVLNFTDNSSLIEIDNNTGLIIFTPDIPQQNGTYFINISVKDELGMSDWQVFKLHVYINHHPKFTPIPGYNISEDIPFWIKINATDLDNDSLTFTTNLTFLNLWNNNSNYTVINGTFNHERNGSHMVQMNVTDGMAENQTSFWLNVSLRNDEPQFRVLPSSLAVWNTTTEGVSYVILINATDEENDSLGFTVRFYDTGKIFGITRLDDNPGYARISFTPNYTSAGNYTVEISVNDSINVTTDKFNFSIISANSAPVLEYVVPNSTRVFMKENVTARFNASYTDPDGNNPLTYRWMMNGTNISNTANLSFTPTFCQAGNYVLVLAVNDSTNRNTSKTWNLTINNTNRKPVLNNTFSDKKWAEDINMTNNFTLSGYFYDNDTIECAGINSDTLTYRIKGNGTMRVAVNSSNYNVSFYPKRNYFGNMTIRFNLSDGHNYTLSNYIKVNITNVNDAPEIATIQDNTTSINRLFQIRVIATDPDNDTLYYYDNTTLFNISNTTGLISFTPSSSQTGNYSIMITVNDSYGASDTETFVLGIINNSRPVFGRKTYTTNDDFSGGTDTRTNSSSNGNITLSKTGGDYYLNGNYLSPQIDFGDDNMKPNLTMITWQANTPVNTTIKVQTRYKSSAGSWSNWSMNYTNSSGQQIQFNHSAWQNRTSDWTNRYIQYKVHFISNHSSRTPTLESLSINYRISNTKMLEDQNVDDWIDLDDYFSDPEGSTLYYNVTSVSNVQSGMFTIDSGNRIDVTPPANWYGTSVLNVRARDQASEANATYTYSNNITFVVIDVPDESTTTIIIQSSGGGGGGGATRIVTQTKIKNVTKEKFMELILPRPLIVSSNKTIIAPLTIQNKGNSTLKGVTLSAVTNHTGVKLNFEKYYFNQIGPGESYDTNLYIQSETNHQAYQITVTAAAQEPAYNDSAVISITPLPILNQSVAFVRDLLSTNPECLELNELLEEAKTMIEEGNYRSAEDTLAEVVEGCRYLITANQEANREQPSFVKDKIGFLKKNVVPISIITGLLVMILVVGQILKMRSRRY